MKALIKPDYLHLTGFVESTKNNKMSADLIPSEILSPLLPWGQQRFIPCMDFAS